MNKKGFRSCSIKTCKDALEMKSPLLEKSNAGQVLGQQSGLGEDRNVLLRFVFYLEFLLQINKIKMLFCLYIRARKHQFSMLVNIIVFIQGSFGKKVMEIKDI